MREHADHYADALFNIISCEGNINEIEDELFRFSQIVKGNDELTKTLGDQRLPVARRLQIIEDLLDGKAHNVTIGLLSMLIINNRFRELGTIVEKLLKSTAELSNRSIAEVRSAVPLSDEQKARLATSLKQKLGHDVEVMVVIDPTVLGGIVTQIGDTVIDGSIRHRLSQLKESF